jgi:hypothetical protein
MHWQKICYIKTIEFLRLAWALTLAFLFKKLYDYLALTSATIFLTRDEEEKK